MARNGCLRSPAPGMFGQLPKHARQLPKHAGRAPTPCSFVFAVHARRENTPPSRAAIMPGDRSRTRCGPRDRRGRQAQNGLIPRTCRRLRKKLQLTVFITVFDVLIAPNLVDAVATSVLLFSTRESELPRTRHAPPRPPPTTRCAANPMWGVTTGRDRSVDALSSTCMRELALAAHRATDPPRPGTRRR